MIDLVAFVANYVDPYRTQVTAFILVTALIVEVVFAFRAVKRQKHWKTKATATLVALLLFCSFFYKASNDFLAGFLFFLYCVFHSKTVFGLITHPWELPPLLKYSFFRRPDSSHGSTHDELFCYRKLKEVSRSFYPVTMALDKELREAICIFYLVCRGLDTIEDDMAPPVQDKINELHNFYKHLDAGKSWNLHGYGEVRAEIDLLKHFEHVITVFGNLQPKYQKIISGIARQMGAGMAQFLEKSVETMDDYNDYCWFVAGLVGEGLTHLFVASGREDPEIDNFTLYKSMGLYLQKVNITRDFYEDINVLPAPRMFYPRAIWGKYADNLKDFLLPQNIGPAVQCLNEMVTDAMAHAVDVLEYLAQIRDPYIFRFCAIPQVMAIATLYEVYNNQWVFRGEVKIRRSLALYIALNCNSMSEVYAFFLDFARQFEPEIPDSDPNAQRLREYLTNIRNKCIQGSKTD